MTNGTVDTQLAALCRACGMCCDGSLFGFVDLEPVEIDTARRHRLPVVRSGRGFTQPCSALVAGDGGCAIYEERPLACRRFTCRLHDRHRREGGALEARLTVVLRVRELVARLDASGWTPTELETADGAIAPDLRDAHRELTELLEDDFARAR